MDNHKEKLDGILGLVKISVFPILMIIVWLYRTIFLCEGNAQ
jgi:hypothetical protein